MYRRWIVVAAVVLACALAGCGATTSPAGSDSHDSLPTTLLVTRTGNPFDRILPLSGGSTDAAAVQRLYHAMYALPHVPDGIYNCPADFGVVYTLTFMDGGTLVLKARAAASGCRFLALGDHDSRTTNDAFWSLLARTAGIPLPSIHPVPAS